MYLTTSVGVCHLGVALSVVLSSLNRALNLGLRKGFLAKKLHFSCEEETYMSKGSANRKVCILGLVTLLME